MIWSNDFLGMMLIELKEMGPGEFLGEASEYLLMSPLEDSAIFAPTFPCLVNSLLLQLFHKIFLVGANFFAWAQCAFAW